MAKQIFVNLPVSDVAKSTAFYEALGFTKNPNFSDEHASSMMWSADIIFMILSKEFYAKFIGDKKVADAHSTSGVVIALPLDSKEEVQKFVDTAQANGGSYYRVDMGVPEDMMFGYEVEDLDGNHLEPLWMSPNFNPQSS